MAWVRSRLTVCVQELAAGVLAFAGAIPLLVLSLLSLGFLPLFGVGVLLVPAVASGVRALADARRRMAQDWAGMRIPVPYRPRPAFSRHAAIRAFQRCRWVLADPATWRDLLWLVCAPVSLVLGILPAGIVVYGLEGIIAVPVVAAVTDGGYGYTFGWAVDFPGEGLAAIPQGVLILLLGLAAAPWLARVHAAFAHSLLAPIRSAALTQRVRQLTETRADALDAQAAELRRIERDLHDGAQARLAATGMSLSMAEDMLTTRPELARQLLAEARQINEQAMAELRGLIRGIHPPLLAEQGLDMAVRGLGLALPIPVDVDIGLPGSLAPAVESAAYFGIAEALANVAKHSHARAARVTVQHADGRLMMTVGDDGVGGADPRRGTGLAGIQRRLAAFDGTLDVASPPGGPTVVTMEMPCEFLSPRTTPSSGTA